MIKHYLQPPIVIWKERPTPFEIFLKEASPKVLIETMWELADVEPAPSFIWKTVSNLSLEKKISEEEYQRLILSLKAVHDSYTKLLNLLEVLKEKGLKNNFSNSRTHT